MNRLKEEKRRQPWDWGAFIDRGAGASFGERSRRSDCDCVLVYLQRHVNSFIFGFHPVSRFRSEQGKEGVPRLGPLLHFFADRRHLYAFEPCHHRRNGGVGAVWRHLGGSRGGNRI